VQRCLKFQQTILVEAMDKTDAIKYVAFKEFKRTPRALVAPYFYLTESNFEAWLDVEVRCCAVARELAKDDQLYAGVVISAGLLNDDDKRTKIVDALIATNVDGFLLWVDDFDEQQAGVKKLGDFLKLARALRGTAQREVINLHGGYFSVLAAGNLGKGALSGVTHAPEFGEYRSVVPVGGGIPMARYYIPQLHARVRYREALRLFREMGWLKDAETFHSQVCDCKVCRDTLNGDAANFVLFGKGNVREVRRGTGIVRIDFPTGETKTRCLEHYLRRKKLEYTAASERSANDLISELRNGHSTYADYLGDGVDYLNNWIQAFG
jgi:hypothetical protein